MNWEKILFWVLISIGSVIAMLCEGHIIYCKNQIKKDHKKLKALKEWLDTKKEREDDNGRL